MKNGFHLAGWEKCKCKCKFNSAVQSKFTLKREGLCVRLSACARNKSVYLVEEPRAEDDLDEVVDDEQPAELKSRPVLHVGRAPHLDDHDVAQTNHQRRQRRAHKEPVLHPPICMQTVTLVLYTLLPSRPFIPSILNTNHPLLWAAIRSCST